METIAAISTAIGNGGIGIIRMSGKESFNILQKIFVNNKEKKIKIDKIKGYTMQYGYIINKNTGEKIDEVIVSFFKNPKSYTKEDMCEINSHGGMIVEKQILNQCLENGAILSEPGEFTKRAFLNGRIDLSQAESIMDLINSKTEKEAKASINQLQGELSGKINEIRHYLLDMMADIEAAIDYPEYDIEEITNKKAFNILENTSEKLNELKNTFNTGKILKEGIKTAIIGRPNVGKSSLLNNILKEERAIVSEIEGTTRDTIEEYISINGIALKIIDTAGIRKTSDTIEKIGVKKALDIANEAELVLAIFDNTKELNKEDLEILEIIKNKNAIILLNKIDIKENNLENNLELINTNKDIIKISAKKGKGINELYKAIENIFQIEELDNGEEAIVTNIRHKNQIEYAIKSIEQAKEAIKNNLPIDIISISIKQALEDLGKITGENVSEDIINEIFSKFCLGK
ncbi:MAG: tRNA uridine-5-carboxymethylaminomethyl(34) synthesis GTPase MnmE [Clostridiaceae bacterium]|nr:tRNA uridine-5-carboxymethylaminomethyl(34) synthesis GTPase MnmE [Clostridiaceae bacterium]